MALALITGATSGIGKELALLMAAKSFSLILTGRSQTVLEELKNSLKTPVTPLSLDLANRAEREKLLQVIVERVPDVVINNAGFGLYGEVDCLSTDEQRSMCAVNMEAPLEITLTAIKALKKEKKGGVILNVSSIAGDIPTPLMSLYGATKAFMTAFSKSLYYEMKREKIYVLTALPGQVATSFAKRAAKKEIEQQSFLVMSAQFAAQEILWQIEKRKKIHRFCYRYKIVSWFCRYLLPDFLVAKSVATNLEKRQ